MNGVFYTPAITVPYLILIEIKNFISVINSTQFILPASNLLHLSTDTAKNKKKIGIIFLLLRVQWAGYVAWICK
jgi:hypothetical protein